MAECPPGVHSLADFCPGNCEEPLTAREILEGYNLPDGVVDEALIAHARALADKLRGFGMEDAGNFIDPEGNHHG
ncbi:hypothetical protein ACFY9R_26540 [Streptomyces albidoflavus]|uniref:hypothetical protein n=1 Tax=Streptomyces albidoflavus TaxID=1886 RepID=UPI0033DA9273